MLPLYPPPRENQAKSDSPLFFGLFYLKSVFGKLEKKEQVK